MPSGRLVQTRPLRGGRPKGLVSDRNSGRRVHAAMFAPTEATADRVEAFWIGRWALPAEAPHRTELLADPSMHLVFERSDERIQARVVGVWTELWERLLRGRGEVRGAKLRPGAWRGFFDDSADGYRNRQVPLGEVLQADELAPLSHSVWSASDDGEALAVLDDWLASRRRERAVVDETVAAMELLRQDREIVSVHQLAAAVSLSPRGLERRFRAHVGASPKWAIRRYRLQDVAAKIAEGHAPSLADLAVELGYVDQAHMSRDFKAAVGRSPGDFRAFSQATGHADDRPSAHADVAGTDTVSTEDRA